MNSDAESSPNILCSSCESSIDDAKLSFKCETCHSEQENAQQIYADFPTMPIFCDICILPHIRKKHNVVDYKNMEVIVCETHKLNCDKFCKTCEILICFKCYDYHYQEKHAIVLVEEKASEIKKVIHEALSENDKSYKPIAATLDSQKTSVAYFCDLKERFDAQTLFKSLSEIFKQCFDRHLTAIAEMEEHLTFATAFLQNEIKQSESSLESIDSKQTSLRCLLGLSDAKLVDQTIRTKSLNNALEPLKEDSISSDSQEFARIMKQNFEAQQLGFVSCLNVGLEKYFSQMNLTLLTRRLQGQGISIFGHFGSKVEIATSDTLLCIAILQEDKKTIYIEFFNSLDESVHKRFITADHDCFKLFSCYGGVVARFHPDTYGVFKTRNGYVTLSSKWKYSKEVTGFIFTEESNDFKAYNVSQVALEFQSCFGDLRLDRDISGIYISTTVRIPDSVLAISFCNDDGNNAILLHKRVTEHSESQSHFLPKFPSTIQEVKTEQSLTGLVAVGLDRSSGLFALVPLGIELEPLRETVLIKKFELSKHIRKEIYFNCSAYLVTDDGHILKVPQLLNIT